MHIFPNSFKTILKFLSLSTNCVENVDISNDMRKNQNSPENIRKRNFFKTIKMISWYSKKMGEKLWLERQVFRKKKLEKSGGIGLEKFIRAREAKLVKDGIFFSSELQLKICIISIWLRRTSIQIFCNNSNKFSQIIPTILLKKKLR